MKMRRMTMQNLQEMLQHVQMGGVLGAAAT